MRKKLIAGAAVLALLMNTPQVKADDDIVIFGGEFEDMETKPAPKVEKPAPIKDLPKPVEKPFEPEPIPPAQIEEPVVEPTPPAQVEEPVVEPLPPAQVEEPVVEPIPPAQVEEPVVEPIPPAQVEEPVVEPIPPAQVEEPFNESPEIDRPFELPSEVASEPVVIMPPRPPQSVIEMPRPQPAQEKSARRVSPTPRNTQPNQNLKMLPTRFIKLAVDDTYTYYLDKTSVQWRKMPYSSSEYIADVWIRMIEREQKNLNDDMAYYGAENFNAEISLAREQGYQYPPEDLQVLRSQGYVLEHYYLRPKTKQVQFLCELEVFGRPQNTISERNYDYKNWENLVPGSIESVIYDATIKIIGKSKATERGHMTFSDMLDEYLRISL